VLTTANANGTTAQRAFRRTEELEIINFGYPSDDLYERCLASAIAR
jgi:hypothetical protein